MGWHHQNRLVSILVLRVSTTKLPANSATTTTCAQPLVPSPRPHSKSPVLSGPPISLIPLLATLPVHGLFSSILRRLPPLFAVWCGLDTFFSHKVGTSLFGGAYFSTGQ